MWQWKHMEVLFIIVLETESHEVRERKKMDILRDGYEKSSKRVGKWMN